MEKEKKAEKKQRKRKEIKINERAITQNLKKEREKKSNLFCFIECYWNDADNRRSFFEKYAKEHGFNPLVPENWYTISAYDCMTQKVRKNKNKKDISIDFFLSLFLSFREHPQY